MQVSMITACCGIGPVDPAMSKDRMHACWLLALTTLGALSLPNHAEGFSLCMLCHALDCNELVLRGTFTPPSINASECQLLLSTRVRKQQEAQETDANKRCKHARSNIDVSIRKGGTCPREMPLPCIENLSLHFHEGILARDCLLVFAVTFNFS
jgi:hypothetical protein